MSLFEELDREWAWMMRSEDIGRGTRHWTDPALRRFSSPNQVVDYINERGHPVQGDEVLRALVNLAPTDALATRTVLQAMMPGIRAATNCYRWTQENDEVVSAAVSTAFCMIRNYPLHKRPNRIASNIVADTKRALHDQFVFVPTREPATDDLDMHVAASSLTSYDRALATVGEAVKDGVVSKADGKLIVETRLLGVPLNEIAHLNEVQPQTLRRRRDRAEASIREAEIALPM